MDFEAEEYYMRGEERAETKRGLQKLFNAGKYRELIETVDSMFGWQPGELGREEYTKKVAITCMKRI